MTSATIPQVPEIPLMQRNGNCTICCRPVYAVEAVIADSRFYHKACFKCVQCKRTLSIMNHDTHDGLIYCTIHVPQASSIIKRSNENIPAGLVPQTTGSTASLAAALNQKFSTMGQSPGRPLPKHSPGIASPGVSGHRKAFTVAEVPSPSFLNKAPSPKKASVTQPAPDAESPAGFRLPAFPVGLNDGSSVTDRVRAMSSEKPSGGSGPTEQSLRNSPNVPMTPAPKLQDTKVNVPMGPAPKLQDILVDKSRVVHERSKSSPTLDLGDDQLSSPTSTTMERDRRSRERAIAEGLRVQTQLSGGSRFLRMPGMGSDTKPAAPRSPSAEGEKTAVTSTPKESNRATPVSGIGMSDLDSTKVGGDEERNRLSRMRWGSDHNVNEQERLKIKGFSFSPRGSTGEPSIQSLLRLNVSALTEMDQPQSEEGSNALKDKKNPRLSHSMETLSQRKGGALTQFFSTQANNMSSMESMFTISSVDSLLLLAELSHIVSTQGADLLSIYEALGTSSKANKAARKTSSSVPMLNDLYAPSPPVLGLKPQMAIALTVFRGMMDSVRKIIDIASPLVSVKELRNHIVNVTKRERELEREIGSSGTCESLDVLRTAIKETVAGAHSVVGSVTAAQKRLLVKASDGYRLEAFGDYDVMPLQWTDNPSSSSPYTSYELEHFDVDAEYYRKHFFNHEHRTYIGEQGKLGPTIVSLMYKSNSPKKEAPAAGGTASQTKDKERNSPDAEYWAIMRTKDSPDLRAVIQASQVNSGVLRQKPDSKTVLSMLHREIQPQKLRKVMDPSIIPRLLALDELQFVTRYKFGALYCKGSQSTEEEYFGNETGSPAFERFLQCVGDKVELTGWPGYSAGLDTKNGQTGKYSLYSKWRTFDVMFHVSTFLPYKKQDKQQIQRKRHIGNDIVTLVFVEGEGRFDPKSVKSQFLHVFVVVQEDTTTIPGKLGYRVVLASSTDVPLFGPPLPNPPVFWDPSELRDFVLAKMINAENAAYKAPKFNKPHHRTRNAVLDEVVRDYWGSSKGRGDRRRDDKAPSNRSSVTSVGSESSTTPITPRPEVGLPRRPSMFSSLGGAFVRRASSVDRDPDVPFHHPSIPSTIEQSRESLPEDRDALEAKLQDAKQYSGSMDGLATQTKKGNGKGTTKSSSEEKAKARSTNNLASSESIGDSTFEGKRKQGNSNSLLNAFKRKGQNEGKKRSQSMESVECHD